MNNCYKFFFDKMTNKSQKFHKTEEFIRFWEDEFSWWDVRSPAHKDRKQKKKGVANLIFAGIVSRVLFLDFPFN